MNRLDAALKYAHNKYGKVTGGPFSVCAICGKPADKRALARDHCHKTGVHRGYLCTQCNVGLGHFQDKIELLERAIEYLRATQDIERILEAQTDLADGD